MHTAHNSDKHQFALYWSELSSVALINKQGAQVEINDSAIVHRMQHVLRLGPDDCCVIFDRSLHALVTIKAYTKRSVIIQIEQQQPNEQYNPHIRFLLPLLKREHLDEALYSLTEMGVNQIDLIITSKSRSEDIDSRLQDRMLRVITAAAEQSKFYAMPLLKGPYKLVDALNHSVHAEEMRLFFDPLGKTISSLLSNTARYECITALVGPEGDLTDDEKKIVAQKGFQFCALTPTILRAHQATALAAGILRSWYLY